VPCSPAACGSVGVAIEYMLDCPSDYVIVPPTRNRIQIRDFNPAPTADP